MEGQYLVSTLIFGDQRSTNERNEEKQENKQEVQENVYKMYIL